MPYIEIKNVTKKFTDQSVTKTVINNISFNINHGEFVILQGKNGAGKSTLINLILGLSEPNQGTIQLFGKSPAVALNQMGGLYKQAQWSGLQTIVRVVRTRHLWNKTEKEVMFYLSSLPPDAQRLGKAIRQHWSIENQLHWVLDVTFGEDACRIRTGNAPENMALLKRWSINLLNQETSFKKSTRQKAMQRGLGGSPHERLHQDGEASRAEDSTYLLKVLNASIPLQSNVSEV